MAIFASWSGKDNMIYSRRIELASGSVTGIFWVFYWLFYSLRMDDFAMDELIGTFVVFGVPGLFVAVGAYAHAVQGNPWGRVLLMVGCSILILVFLLSLFGGIGYYGGVAILAVLTPAVTGIITVLASRDDGFDDV